MFKVWLKNRSTNTPSLFNLKYSARGGQRVSVVGQHNCPITAVAYIPSYTRNDSGTCVFNRFLKFCKGNNVFSVQGKTSRKYLIIINLQTRKDIVLFIYKLKAVGLILFFCVDAQNQFSCTAVGTVSVIERRSMGVTFDLRNRSQCHLTVGVNSMTCNNSFSQVCLLGGSHHQM